MRVKLILPALTEAKSPLFRPIKYSLFPPLGLATLAGYLDEDDEVVLQDEHVEALDLDDDPELVVIQVYITSATRSYQSSPTTTAAAALTSPGWAARDLPARRGAAHADTVFLGRVKTPGPPSSPTSAPGPCPVPLDDQNPRWCAADTP